MYFKQEFGRTTSHWQWSRKAMLSQWISGQALSTAHTVPARTATTTGQSLAKAQRTPIGICRSWHAHKHRRICKHLSLTRLTNQCQPLWSDPQPLSLSLHSSLGPPTCNGHKAHRESRPYVVDNFSNVEAGLTHHRPVAALQHIFCPLCILQRPQANSHRNNHARNPAWPARTAPVNLTLVPFARLPKPTRSASRQANLYLG